MSEQKLLRFAHISPLLTSFKNTSWLVAVLSFLVIWGGSGWFWASAAAQEPVTQEAKEVKDLGQTGKTVQADSLEQLLGQLEQELQAEIAQGLKSEDKKQELTMAEALAQAWAFNAELRSQRRSTEETNAARKAFYLQFVPSVRLSASLRPNTAIVPYRQSGGVIAQSNEWQTTVPYSAGLSADVTLFDMSLLTRLSQLSNDYQSQLISEEILRKTIAINIIKQVYTVLKAAKQLEINKLSLNIKTKYFNSAHSDYNSGRISRLDYLISQNELQSSQTNLLGSQFDLQRAQRTLNLLLGYVPQQELEVAVQLNSNIGSLLDQALPAFDPEMPELRQKKLAQRHAEQNLSEAYLALLPQFSIRGSLNLDFIDSSLYRSDGQDITTSIGTSGLSSSIQLTWDLSNFLPFSNADRNIRQSRNKLKQAREAYEETLRQKRIDYLDQLQSLLQNKKLLEAHQSSLAVAKERLREAELSYNRGLISYDALLSAQHSLENLQTSADELVFIIMETLLQLGGNLNSQYI